jgi:hypothetical protein
MCVGKIGLRMGQIQICIFGGAGSEQGTPVVAFIGGLAPGAPAIASSLVDRKAIEARRTWHVGG